MKTGSLEELRSERQAGPDRDCCSFAPVQKDAKPATAQACEVRGLLGAGMGATAHDSAASGQSHEAQAVVQMSGASAHSHPDALKRTAVQGIQGEGGQLPYLDRIQKSFGSHDVSTVKAHASPESQQANRALGSAAYAVGNHVAFESAPDLRTAAHEAAHAVQQRSGVQLSQGIGQVGDRYEKQADAVADRVVRGQSVGGMLGDSKESAEPAGDAVQMLTLVEKQQKKALANTKHTQDRNKLKQIIVNGLAKDRNAERRLVNACEWAKSGKVKMYAVTMTGDNDERATANGEDPVKTACWFPKATSSAAAGDIYSAAVTYNHLDFTDNTNVEIDNDDGKITDGWNMAGLIAVANASTASEAYVFETLRHEVQHDADQSRDKTTDAPNAMAKNLEGYKTEYRAYSYEKGAFDAVSAVTNVNKYGFQWKARQLAIFEEVFGGYTHTSGGWGKKVDGKPVTKTVPSGVGAALAASTAQANFQAAVVAYVNPDSEGFNKWNSVRVDAAYKKIKLVSDGTSDKNDVKYKALATACFTTVGTKLLREDAQYILTGSPDWTTLINTKLSGDAKTDFRTKLGGVT